MTVVQITVSLVCIATSVVTTANGKLKWKEHYDKTKQTAQTSNRPMLLVLENPSNKTEKIDETKLTEKERKILAQEKFELCRVDINTDYGKRVAAAFGASQFPYTVVTDDSSKRIVFRKPGQMSEQDWTLALAKSTRQSTSLVSPKPAAKSASPVVVNQAPTSTSPVVAPQGATSFGVPVNGGVFIPQAVPAAGTCFT